MECRRFHLRVHVEVMLQISVRVDTNVEVDMNCCTAEVCEKADIMRLVGARYAGKLAVL